MARSRRRPVLVAMLLAVAAAAHLAYWYWPRERPGEPQAGGLPERLLAAVGEDEYAVWVPYPHQNLAVLRRAGSTTEEWSDALYRLLELPRMTIPSFGPFSFPPARELTVVSDRAGGRLRLAARIYPSVAAVARLAGRLAGNPWLAGGAVEIEGRSLEVAWRGSVWTVATVGSRWPEAPPAPESGAPLARAPGAALAWFGLGRPAKPMPAGLYRLARSGPDLDLDLDGAEPLGWWHDQTPPPAPMLLARGGERAAPRSFNALAVLGREGEELQGLPPMVSLRHLGGRPWRLPAEAILKLLGRRPLERPAGDWRIVAVGDEELERGAEILPAVAALAERRPAGAELVLGVSVDLDAAREGLGSLVGHLDALPAPLRADASAWRAGLFLAAALAGYDHLSLAVEADPAAASLRLGARPAALPIDRNR